MQRKLSQLPINGNMLFAAQNKAQQQNHHLIALHHTVKAIEVAL